MTATTQDQSPPAEVRRNPRHAMLACTVVLEGESKSHFFALLESLHLEHQPATETETVFVESMAVARWRQMRIWGIATRGFNSQMACHQGQPVVRASQAFTHLSDNSRSLDLLNRLDNSHERQFARALKNLLTLKATRSHVQASPYVPTSGPSATWEEPDFQTNLIPKSDTSPTTPNKVEVEQAVPLVEPPPQHSNRATDSDRLRRDCRSFQSPSIPAYSLLPSQVGQALPPAGPHRMPHLSSPTAECAQDRPGHQIVNLKPMPEASLADPNLTILSC